MLKEKEDVVGGAQRSHCPSDVSKRKPTFISAADFSIYDVSKRCIDPPTAATFSCFTMCWSLISEGVHDRLVKIARHGRQKRPGGILRVVCLFEIIH